MSGLSFEELCVGYSSVVQLPVWQTVELRNAVALARLASLTGPLWGESRTRCSRSSLISLSAVALCLTFLGWPTTRKSPSGSRDLSAFKLAREDCPSILIVRWSASFSLDVTITRASFRSTFVWFFIIRESVKLCHIFTDHHNFCPDSSITSALKYWQFVKLVSVLNFSASLGKMSEAWQRTSHVSNTFCKTCDSSSMKYRLSH